VSEDHIVYNDFSDQKERCAKYTHPCKDGTAKNAFLMHLSVIGLCRNTWSGLFFPLPLDKII